MPPEENANPQGSENQANDNIEAAFEQYLTRQAAPAGGEGAEEQPAQGAQQGQPASEAKPEAPEAPEPEEQRFKVKIHGEEKEVPLSELLKGYSQEADYRIKTSQVAEQARQAQALAQQAQQEQARYAQALQTYAQQLKASQPQAPDPALIQTDPLTFLQQQQAYQAWQQQAQQVQAEQQQLATQQQQQQQQAMQQRISSERDLLLKALPDFADEAKGKVLKAEISVFLEKQGYAPDEIAGAVDHRAIVLAHKAMQYDKLMAQQKAATNKVANLPPRAPQRPGSGEVAAPDGRTRAMQALKKTGSIDDAAMAFASFLGAKP